VTERVGFIGLGIMGRPMAHNLLNAGFPLAVHSRSPAPVDELVSAGATRCDGPSDVASVSDVVITMLPDTPDVEAVLLGDQGVLDAISPGSLVVDMSTIDPIATRSFAAAFSARGVGIVDAPVSGGEKGALNASLSIMVGGDDDDVARAMPLFRAMGTTIVHVGASGAGQVTKACNQLVVASTIQAVAEALGLAKRAGVDPGKVREALLGGLAGSKILEIHGQRMIERAFAPGFRTRLHLKDARIVRRTAEQLASPTPAFDVVAEALAELVEEGGGDLDHSALFTLVAPGGAGGSRSERERASDSPPQQPGGAGGSRSERERASDSPPQQPGGAGADPFRETR
jgi:2-hydroxy-3-oxopropionate reductase